MSFDLRQRRQALIEAARRIADEVAGAERDRGRQRGPLPAGGRRRAARGAACSPPSSPSSSAAAAPRWRRSPRPASSSARRCGATGDGLRDAPDPGRLHGPPPRDGAPWFDEYLREVVAEQRLIASITSEVGTGGDMGKLGRRGHRPGDDGVVSFEKQAPTVSYGPHADAFLTTAAPRPRRRARRPGPRPHAAATRWRWSRRAPGTRWGCAAPARPASSSTPRLPQPSRSCRRRSRRSRPSR